MLLATSFSTAQSADYESRMATLIAQSDTAVSVAGRRQLAQAFAQVAAEAKNQWLPYYYAAYSLTRAAVDETVLRNIDPFTEQATVWLDEAEHLRADPSELAVVRAMILYARIPVHFAMRAVSNLERAQELLAEARKQNPDNPRIYVLMGQRAYRAPVGFGGSKKEALAYFEKALAIFEKQAPKAGQVHWGRTTALQMAQSCRQQLARSE